MTMLPTLSLVMPKGLEWLYEVKYDGYRAKLYLQHGKIKLISRNGVLLNDNFIEIIKYCKQFFIQTDVVLDGEVVVLDSPFKANFFKLKNRKQLPCVVQYLAFDILKIKQVSLISRPYLVRKKLLQDWFSQCKLAPILQFVAATSDGDSLWQKVAQHDGEGIVAKKKTSIWKAKRTTEWLKIKHWKYDSFFITGYSTKTGLLYLAAVEQGKIRPMGTVLHGFSPKERETLLAVLNKHQIKQDKDRIDVKSGICLEVRYLELYKGKLRQPSFVRFRFDLSAEDCQLPKGRT
ncbi:MAG: hypothetical protein RLZ12_631 [Bacillota bacterium]|jgi:bifunctional non-homologous end joining protein LigD